MNERVSNVRLGLFILTGVAALVLGIFLVGSQQGLFHPMFRVSTYFDGVQGINSGSAVRLSGVDIGLVDRVEVSPANNRVRMDLKLNSGVRGFIKKDSYATIEPEGLVGNYFVAVTVGSAQSDAVEEGDVIQSHEPVRLTVILDDVQGIVANLRRATEEFSGVLLSINKGQGTLGKLVTDDKAYRHFEGLMVKADTGVGQALRDVTAMSHALAGLSGPAGNVVHKADTLMTSINSIASKLNGGRGTLGALIGERALYDSLLLVAHNGVGMTEEAKAGASKFAEDMEALKHNLLFKGYFEDRGYWDKADFERGIDSKILQLRQLESEIARKSEQLRSREEHLRKRDGEVPDKQNDHP